ncbi:MAG TPA: hypothetical protein DCQ98_21620 [Planctomycetaceae bacterium]|nr:hypothetical protein [Planctomycetaceae bacterium]
MVADVEHDRPIVPSRDDGQLRGRLLGEGLPRRRAGSRSRDGEVVESERDVIARHHAETDLAADDRVVSGIESRDELIVPPLGRDRRQAAVRIHAMERESRETRQELRLVRVGTLGKAHMNDRSVGSGRVDRQPDEMSGDGTRREQRCREQQHRDERALQRSDHGSDSWIGDRGAKGDPIADRRS